MIPVAAPTAASATSCRRRQSLRHEVTWGDDVTRSRAVDVPGGHQGLLHARRAALSVRQPALSGRLHLVDVPRLQTERDVQRDRATDHLLHTQEPGRHVIHVDTEKLLKKLEELSIEVYITHAGHSIA